MKARRLVCSGFELLVFAEFEFVSAHERARRLTERRATCAEEWPDVGELWARTTTRNGPTTRRPVVVAAGWQGCVCLVRLVVVE